MTAPFPTPGRVPAAAVKRLLEQTRKLVEAVGASANEQDSTSPEAGRAQRVYRLLDQEYMRLGQEAAQFYQGQREPLLQHASDLRLLARRMDTFRGPDQDVVDPLCQLLVLTAWQIAAAASGSEAAGL